MEIALAESTEPLPRGNKVKKPPKNLFIDLGLPWQALGKRSGANVSSHYNLYNAAGIKWVMAARWLCVHWTCTLWPSKGSVRWLGGRRWIGSKEQQQQAVFIQWESDMLRYVRAYRVICFILSFTVVFTLPHPANSTVELPFPPFSLHLSWHFQVDLSPTLSLSVFSEFEELLGKLIIIFQESQHQLTLSCQWMIHSIN